MVKEFNKLEEIEKYYSKETNTYVFKEDGKWIDLVIFNFNLRIGSNIKAHDINARDICASDIDVYDINARDIKVGDINACNIDACNIDAHNINACNIKADYINAHDINAWNIRASRIRARDINANDINSFFIVADNINYFTVCFAYENIKCKSIKGRRPNAEHFVLDGKIEITGEE